MHVTELGEDIPPDLWATHDFAIFTCDLITKVKGCKCDDALRLAQLAAEQCSGSFANMCVVGIKLDEIPPTPLDMATTVHRAARALANRAASLRLFPVSCVSQRGISDLYTFISKRHTCSARRRQSLKSIAYLVQRVHPHTVVERPSPSDRMWRVFDSWRTWALDAFARLLSLPVPKDVNQAVSQSQAVRSDIRTYCDLTDPGYGRT